MSLAPDHPPLQSSASIPDEFNPYSETDKTLRDFEPTSRASTEGGTSNCSVYPTKKWHILSAVLHGLFVLLHVILVIVMTRGVEKKVLIPLGSPTEFWTTFIHIALQFFAIVYLAGALFISQKLFMQRLLVTTQTITTSHDQYTSWLGLGALYEIKHSVRSSCHYIPFGFCGCEDHQPVPTATSSTAYSVLPDDDNYTQRGDTGDDGPVLANLLSPALMISMNSSTDGNSSLISTLGLQGNTLYDVIPVIPNITENVEINAHTIKAQCQSFDYHNFGTVSPYLNLTFALTPLSLVETTAGYLGLAWNESKSTNFRNASATSSKILFFGSMFNISDSAGAYAPAKLPLSDVSFLIPDGNLDINNLTTVENIYATTPISAGTTPTCSQNLTAMARGPKRSNWFANSSGFSFGSCRLDVVPSRAWVDGEKRTLVNPVPRKNSSTWTEASLPDPSMWIPHTMYSFHPVLGSGFSTFGTYFDCGFLKSDGKAAAEFYRSPSLFEQFITDRLHLFSPDPSQINDKVTPWPTIMLHDFENALEDYVAAYLFTREKSLEMMSGAPPASNQVLIQATVNMFVSQLTLRPLPVFMGLAMSIVLFAISFWIIITTPLEKTTLDSIGLLQMLWIADSELFGPVYKPTENKLRKSGVRLSLKLGQGDLRKRVSAGDTDSEEAEMTSLREAGV
ncbi:hypothetical protein DL96DRAFT_1823762 [Flagelloscypha sp. PMI_526]|nr:hypothetical protein DL96DRAFT_1823762 [Flagelloscypha sp. PMI_526]